MKWRAVWIIARKDIQDAIKNSYILFALVLPIGLSVLFRVVFPSTDELGAVSIAVYDPDGSRLVVQLQGMPDVRLLEVSSAEQVSERVKREAVGGLVLPSGFDAAIEAGERPELTVYTSGRGGKAELATFQRLVERGLWTLDGRELPVQVHFVNLSRLADTKAEAEFHLERYLLVVALVMAISMTGAFVLPTLLVEEKEKHTLDALLVSPVGPAEVVAGKAATGLLYGLVVAGALFVMNQRWIPNWGLTLVVTLLATLFTVMVGLLMGGVLQTTPQVNTWSSVVVLILTMPSWFTVVPTPDFLRSALRLCPSHYMADALSLSLAEGTSLGQLGLHLGVLASSATLLFVAVVWTLRRLAHHSM